MVRAGQREASSLPPNNWWEPIGSDYRLMSSNITHIFGIHEPMARGCRERPEVIQPLAASSSSSRSKSARSLFFNRANLIPCKGAKALRAAVIAA